MLDYRKMIAEIDSELRKLMEARTLLAETYASQNGGVSPKRKKVDGRTKRVLSAKARKAIGDAQRKRWAKIKKAKKTAPHKHAVPPAPQIAA